MKLLAFAIFCLCSVAYSTDIKTKDGRIYKDIKVDDCDSKYVSILFGFPREGTSVSWASLTHESYKALAVLCWNKEVVASKKRVFLDVIQTLGDTVLANSNLGREPVAVYGLPSLADGEKWKGELYPKGFYRYRSVRQGMKSINAYTVSLEQALKWGKKIDILTETPVYSARSADTAVLSILKPGQQVLIDFSQDGWSAVFPSDILRRDIASALGDIPEVDCGSPIKTGPSTEDPAAKSPRRSLGEKIRCSATTRSGRQCSRMTLSPNGLCYQHGGD